MSTRAATRAALMAAAMALFAERGYDATTTAAIAGRAGVSEMTLFRHFAAKSAFVVDDPYDPLIAAAITARPRGESSLRAAVRGVRDAWHAVAPPAVDEVRARLRIVARTATLRSALQAASSATEQAMAAALADRGADRAEAAIVAAAVVAALNTSLLEWSRGDGADIGTALLAAFRALGED